MRRFLAGLIAVLALALAAAPAMARTDPGLKGLPKFECPPGQILAGFTGYVGLWVDSIQGLCAQVNADKTSQQPVPAGIMFGGGTTPNQAVYCRPGTGLKTVAVYFTREKHVAWIRMLCSLLSTEQVAGQVDFGNNRYNNGLLVEQPDFLDDGGRCGIDNGEFATGFYVRPGRYIENFYLICDRVAYPVPVTVKQGPPKSTGKPRPQPAPPSGPSVAHRLAFTGAWDTTLEGGIGYQLILQPQGTGLSPTGVEMPLEVVGTFIYNKFGDIAVKPGENDNNGTLRGVVAPYGRMLVFSYVQNNGRAGTGTFLLSEDGQSITGSIENSEGKSEWSGTRAK